MNNQSNEAIAAQQFIQGAKQLRSSIGADIPIQQLMILTYLWDMDACNQKELAQALGLKKAAASRHCRSLSHYTVERDGQPEEKGQKLIIAERSSASGRETVYRLTETTRDIISRFLTHLADTGQEV